MASLVNYLYLTVFILEHAVAYKSLATVELINNAPEERFSYLHAIQEDLLRQTWEKQEQPCLRHLLNLVSNVQNSTLWATWIWDSMQFPVGQLYGSRNHLGNYDQCMNLPWKDHPEFRTQYCLAEVDLSDLDPTMINVDLLGPVKKYIQYKTRHNLRFNSLIWGLCVPVACKPESITKFSGAMFRATHLGHVNTQINVTVNSGYCQVSGEAEAKGFREYFSLSLIVFLIIITFLCTYYVKLKGDEPKSTVLSFAKAFDIKSNTECLLDAEDQSIRSVLGIRMISIFLILWSHQWLGKNILGVGNADEIDKKLDEFIPCVRFGADMVVDVFFMLSGMLLTKSIMKKKGKSFNMFTILAKRYVRLMCSVVFIILVLPIFLLRGDPGPLVKKVLQIEADACSENWWRTVLMIGNYGDTENMCYPTLWSVACDFHLSIIAVLIYWLYLKNRKVGVTTYIICAVSSIVIPIIHGYLHNSGAVVTFDFLASDNIRKYPVGDPAYVNTHLRAGPYFLGLAIGYLIDLFHPHKHRHVISKKLSTIAFVVFMSMFVSLATMCAIYHGRKYGPLEGALFSVMRRNVFPGIVGFLIFICEYGTLPLVSNILSWPGLVPLSKLSYGVYLTHFLFITRLTSRTRVPLRSDAIEDIYSAIAMLVLTTVVSFMLWLFWEAPIVNLFNIFLKRSAVKVQLNGSIEHSSRIKKLDEKSLEDNEWVDNSFEKKLN